MHERLNTEKQTIMIKYDVKMSGFVYKSYYGDIPNCKARVKYFTI